MSNKDNSFTTNKLYHYVEVSSPDGASVHFGLQVEHTFILREFKLDGRCEPYEHRVRVIFIEQTCQLNLVFRHFKVLLLERDNDVFPAHESVEVLLCHHLGVVYELALHSHLFPASDVALVPPASFYRLLLVVLVVGGSSRLSNIALV